MYRLAKSILFVVIALFSVSLQGSNVDSLLNVIKNHKRDSIFLRAYAELISIHQNNDKLFTKYCTEAISESQKQNNNFYIGLFSFKLGDNNEFKGELVKAKTFYEQAMTAYLQLDSIRLVAEAKNDIGRIYEKLSDYDKALKYYLDALKLREKINDKKGIASSFNSVGLIYYYQGSYKNATKFYSQGLQIVQAQKNDIGIATIYNNMGLSYEKQKQYDSAIFYYTQSLKHYERIQNNYGLSKCYLNLGNMFYIKNDLKNAEKYYFQALNIKKELDDKMGLINTYISIAVLYQKNQQYAKAIEYVSESITISNEIGNKQGLADSYQVLSELYSQIGNYKLAYDNFVKHSAYVDSVFNENSTKYVNQLQEQFQSEKREKEIQLANSKIQQNELKIKQQTTMIYGAVVGLILLLSLALVILRSYREKKKANELLSSQNVEITLQKNIIEQKNLDIMASITYAKRIQEAILPMPQFLLKYFNNLFVLFKPKDIVSGDFYWFIPDENQTLLFAVVDCTGHGVPGAFMSIVGYNSLNQVIKEFNLHDPGKILDQLNILVEQALHTSEQDIKDGMDIAFCSFNTQTNVLKYAGANNPLYIIRSKSLEAPKLSEKYLETESHYIFEIKANAQPIGAYIKRFNFDSHEIQLFTGDSIYVFSDGFADQFGGKDGKKLKYKPFKELLLSLQSQSMEEQKDSLNLFFEEWRGEHEQIDDVCVMGLRI
jgi:tetratricopeptide (TPR) repeat protein